MKVTVGVAAAAAPAGAPTVASATATATVAGARLMFDPSYRGTGKPGGWMT